MKNDVEGWSMTSHAIRLKKTSSNAGQIVRMKKITADINADIV